MRTDRNKDFEFCGSLAHYIDGLYEKREFQEIISLYEQNHAEIDDSDDEISADVLHHVAYAYYALHKPTEALRVIRCAQEKSQAGGDNLQLAEIFITLANIQRDMGQWKEAEKGFRDAESIFRRHNHREGQSRALNLLAGLLFRQNDYRNALTVLMDAVEIARDLGDKVKLAYMLGNIGRIQAFTGDLAEAEKHLVLNIELSTELNDQLETARAWLSLGYLQIQQGEYTKAEQSLEQAKVLIIAQQSRRDEVIYLTYMGELKYKTSQFAESTQLLEHGLSLADQIGAGTILSGRIMRHLAELAVRVGNYRLAQLYVVKALPIIEKTGDKIEGGALWKLKAQIADAANETAKASSCFKTAFSLFTESGCILEKAETLIRAGKSGAFPLRERITFLFRAEEIYSQCNISILRDETSRLIQTIDLSANSDIPPQTVSQDKKECCYLTVNPVILRFLNQLPILGKSDLPILLTGETGVGKDHFARYFHFITRPNGPFIAVNCASLPETLLESELFGYRKGAFTGADSHKEGLFVAANDGILLLDEIGDMPLSLQVKLLRVIERRAVMPLGSTHEVAVDFRLVAATNKNLDAMVEAGTFRRDLYYRLSGITFNLPPLRERKEDIPLLLNHFISCRNILSGGKKLPAELMHQFVEYDWPGNIRELENKVKRLEILVQMVSEGDLGELARSVFASEKSVTSKRTLFERVVEFERTLLLEALMASGGNKCEAARLLGVHEATVRMKLKRYGIRFSTGVIN